MKINKVYTKEEVLDEVNKFFVNEGYVQLPEFFQKDTINNVLKVLSTKKEFENVYNPLYMRRKELDEKNVIEVELIELLEFLKSNEFTEYLEEIIQTELKLVEMRIVNYSHKDYIIINDEIVKTDQKDYLDVIFDITKSWVNESGGAITYTTKEEELLYLNPTFNTLNVIYKDRTIMKYLKYVNNKALNKQIYRIEMKFDIY